MQTLLLSRQENIGILQLNNGGGNAINEKMMDELSAFFSTAESDESIGAIVLSGKENMFTAGLDVVELYSLDQEGSYRFWKKFVDLATQIAGFSKPLIAAVSGYSPAGGCVFACCADYRLMLVGEQFRIGLNEIPVGIVVPERILQLYGFWIGNRRAYQYLMEGRLLSPSQAAEVGLIDQLCHNYEELLQQAYTQAQKYLALPQRTWQMSKLQLRQSLLQAMSVDFESSYGAAMQQFWSPENRAAMGKLVEKLTKGK